MDSVANHRQAAGDAPPRDHEPPSALEERERNRRAAALYLKAAARTGDAVQRSFLKRRAAELILPRFIGASHERIEVAIESSKGKLVLRR